MMLAVTKGVVGRADEFAAVDGLLSRMRTGPAGLILAGEAGIGKTTVWRAGTGMAMAAGFTVLVAGGAAAETSLAFAIVADLLDGISDSVVTDLPGVQQVALNRLLLRDQDGPLTDERVAAAAFLSVLGALSRNTPVLLAIDDIQWLDTPSRTVIGFAARRLNGRVGLLATARTGERADTENTGWLQLPPGAELMRLGLEPLSMGALHSVIATELGHPLSRPAIARIHTVSGGNPFYGVELARTLGDAAGDLRLDLPPSLTALVAERLSTVDADTAKLLLMCSCDADPTVGTLARLSGSGTDRVIELLERAEQHGLICFDRGRVRFTHPLLAHGVYAQASPAQRRATHRALGAIAEPGEGRARHLALASVSADESTLGALDEAAESAAARGAHSAAAELATLAIQLGGATDWRRLRAAEYHFRAGALDEADALLGPLVADLPPGIVRAIALMVQGGVLGYRDGLASAVSVLSRAVEEAGDNMALRTQGRLLLALAAGLTGDMATCVEHARRARADADTLDIAALRSQASALWAHVSFMYGLGTDQPALQTALDNEEPDSIAPATLQAGAVYAINLAWTGDLQEARVKMAEVARRCAERGNEVDVVWASEFATMIDVWLGRYADAERTAADAVERARQIGGQLPMITAQTALAAVAARQGRVEDTLAAVRVASEAAHAGGLSYLAGPPLMSKAFLEVSGGEYTAALQTLEPLLASFDADHGTEIMAGAYLPDAVEALVTLGHTGRAEPLIAALEQGGARLDRPWMLAVGARCRALFHAATGDLDAAQQSAEQAMDHHKRLPMPFERARTQLLLGQLQRRRRRRHAAETTLTEAAGTFAQLGSPLWAARADHELQRLKSRAGTGAGLTDAEHRVAHKAAEGLSNKEIAVALFLAPKTVEMYLSNAYRKLGIRSRAQLATRLSQGDLTDSGPPGAAC